MSLRHGLLGLLNYGSMTGYELHKVFQGSLNFFWQAQASQIYRELNAMERDGWLTSHIEQQTGKPNKKVYAITQSGQQELQKWLRQGKWEDALKVRSAFLMDVFFSGERSREENLKRMRKFEELCSRAVKSMKAADEAIAAYGRSPDDSERKFYWELTALFGKYYYQMCLQWAQDAIRAMEEGAKP